MGGFGNFPPRPKDGSHAQTIDSFRDSQCGSGAWRQAWVRRWRLRHQAPRPTEPPPTTLAPVQALLDAKVRDGELTAAEQASYDRVARVLWTTVRASSVVEGINSVLRMQQGRYRKMTPGMLDLKRLYWNCRRLQTGKRRGR